jgi:Protein of unknown function (DUF1207)
MQGRAIPPFYGLENEMTASAGYESPPNNAARVLLCAVGSLLVLARAAAALGETPAVSSSVESAPQPAGSSENAISARSFSIRPGWTLLLSPVTDLYPRSIADPRRPGFGITYMHVPESQIPDAGTDRAGIRIGGSYGLVRVHPDDKSDRGYQLDIMANFIGQFDLAHALDNIGWDGLYGLAFTWGNGRGLAVKFGVFHDSSHVGDEYAERTGRRRVGYTREEFVAGKAYHLGNEDLQKPWRAQAGLEYESKGNFWGGRLGWYAAADGSFTQERDWHGSTAAQIGFVLPLDDIGRRYRFGVEYYRGRSMIGEFFQDNESYVALGVWLDL